MSSHLYMNDGDPVAQFGDLDPIAEDIDARTRSVRGIGDADVLREEEDDWETVASLADCIGDQDERGEFARNWQRPRLSTEIRDASDSRAYARLDRRKAMTRCAAPDNDGWRPRVNRTLRHSCCRSSRRGR